MLKRQYNFVDISVLLRTGDSEYVNLTDYDFESKENEQIKGLCGIKSKFLITFCSFFKKERYAAEVTVPELLALAGINNRQFSNHIAFGMEKETSAELIAFMCAKKIVNYAYGKCVRIENENSKIEYAFQRKGKRTAPTVLTKEFRLV